MNSSGTVTQTYDYEAYGNELKRDATDTNPFRYCGEYYDVETGFIYLRARYYNPSTGRFISQDPAKDGLNWYAYCNNNPILFVDKNGLWPSWSQIGAAALTIAIAAVAVTAVVASAGTAGAAIGIGASMVFGASGATAATVATGATIGCYGVAVGIGLCAAGDVEEILTDHNFVCDDFMGGNQDVYDFGKSVLYMGAAGITTLAAENPGLKPEKQQENKQYDSYRAYKEDYGKAGEGKQWHHIVEQNQIKKSGFNPRDIYSTRNTVALDKEVHKEVSRYYSSIHSFTAGLRFRDWLKGQPFDVQYEWGVKIMREISDRFRR